MATGKKGSGGKEGGSGDDAGDDDEALHCTPTAGFDIDDAAEELAEAMQDMGLPLIIHFADFDAEFETGCTAEQIRDGYRQVQEMQRDNDRKKPKANDDG